MGRSDWISSVRDALRPPAHLSLSEWVDEEFYLSAESSAEAGPWKTLPYQKEMMDAITDPSVEKVTMMKSARIGYTKMLCAAIGYFIDQDPCPMMVVQPTVKDAEGISKEEIAPMLRDCKALRHLASGPTEKKSSQTILHKAFKGGILSMVGANSGAGFRRVSRRVVLFDEVDGYPASAGKDGAPIKLGINRTEYYWNRKIIAGSTPLTAGASRIEDLFNAGDRRRYHVPCPQCGAKDYWVFRKREDGRSHYMQWPEGDPESAYFVCSESGCVIEHDQKFSMLRAGQWIAAAPFTGHASFHIWAAYSMSPNASWGDIAKEFLEANEGGSEELQTFINTALGETFVEKGEAPDWEVIYNRRETYLLGEFPKEAPVIVLTAGVDVQQDRYARLGDGGGLGGVAIAEKG